MSFLLLVGVAAACGGRIVEDVPPGDMPADVGGAGASAPAETPRQEEPPTFSEPEAFDASSPEPPDLEDIQDPRCPKTRPEAGASCADSSALGGTICRYEDESLGDVCYWSCDCAKVWYCSLNYPCTK